MKIVNVAWKKDDDTFSFPNDFYNISFSDFKVACDRLLKSKINFGLLLEGLAALPRLKESFINKIHKINHIVWEGKGKPFFVTFLS